MLKRMNKVTTFPVFSFDFFLHLHSSDSLERNRVLTFKISQNNENMGNKTF